MRSDIRPTVYSLVHELLKPHIEGLEACIEKDDDKMILTMITKIRIIIDAIEKIINGDKKK